VSQRVVREEIQRVVREPVAETEYDMATAIQNKKPPSPSGILEE
jgi:hypothetical protein